MIWRYIARVLKAIAILLLLLVLILVVWNCHNFRVEVYLIPSGYIGPVVIVYGDPNGMELEDHLGTVVFKINQSGILRVKETFERRWVLAQFYYVEPDGTRQKIPKDGDPTQVHVFAHGGGGTSKTYRDGKLVSYQDKIYVSFMIGAPASLPNWYDIRQHKIEQAVPETFVQKHSDNHE